MGLIGKAGLLAGGFLLYKEYKDKKRVEREFEQYRNTHEAPMNDRGFQSQSQLEFPRDTTPPYNYMDKKSDDATM
jgi:hypothetical protein